MNYDKKLPPLDERATFGNQAPFASAGPSAPDDPYAIPTDVPPVYSPTPSPVETRNPQEFATSSAPLRHPQQVPQSPQQQQNPYGYVPPAGPPPPLHAGQQSLYSPHPSLPSHPPPHQQPFFGGAGPTTNYGATSNAPSPFPHNNNLPPPQGYYYDNNGRPYQPVPAGAHPSASRGPDRHGRGRRGSSSSDSDGSNDHHQRTHHNRRKKKRSGNCCTCCCLTILLIILWIVYLIRSINISGNSCSNVDGYETAVDTMYVPLSSGLNYAYQAFDDVMGDIVVNESDTWDERGIKIMIVKKASNANNLPLIIHTLQNIGGTTVSRVHLRDDLSKDEKKKITKAHGCLRADAQITLPSALGALRRQSVLELGTLNLTTISGEISVRMKSRGEQAYMLEGLNIAVVHGDVEVGNLAVNKATKIEIVNGQITANLVTAGIIETNMVNGGIGLTIDTSAPNAKYSSNKKWNPENLDAEVNIVNGPISVTFMNHFHGHFMLESKVGSTSFTVPDGDRKITPTNPGGRSEGWISEDGVEPPGMTPRLRVQAAVGNIKVKARSRDEV
ncbi:hypothetical protein FBU30_000369 [Linnemannia zychae]|nr:hypothetical protein FBU30_000369 [Linnemannia zychae]